MYFFPLVDQIRLAALPDTVAMEDRLKNFFSDPLVRSWKEFLDEFSEDIVPGDHKLGILFTTAFTFVSDGISVPQISFDDNPESLLFVYSNYTSSEGSFSYDNLRGYFRLHISPLTYEPIPENLSDIWYSLSLLEEKSVSEDNFEEIRDDIKRILSLIDKLSKRSDPLSIVQPAISSALGIFDEKLNDLQEQIDDLQPSVQEGTLDLTNHYTKMEVDNLLTFKTTTGYVDSKFAEAITYSTFDEHVLDIENPHFVTYSQVGAPSLAAHQDLVLRVDDLKSRLDFIDSQDFIKLLQGEGGILVSNEGSGVWNLDTSLIPSPVLSVILNIVSTGVASYTLSASPANVVMVFVDGVLSPLSSYSIEGNTLTFLDIPAAGKQIICVAD